MSKYPFLTFPEIEVEEEVQLADVIDEHQLVVFNDEVNTFEHVIDTLIAICDHTSEQAEQCTWIIHYNGKCAVKYGAKIKLAELCKAICDRGISAEVV